MSKVKCPNCHGKWQWYVNCTCCSAGMDSLTGQKCGICSGNGGWYADCGVCGDGKGYVEPEFAQEYEVNQRREAKKKADAQLEVEVRHRVAEEVDELRRQSEAAILAERKRANLRADVLEDLREEFEHECAKRSEEGLEEHKEDFIRGVRRKWRYTILGVFILGICIGFAGFPISEAMWASVERERSKSFRQEIDKKLEKLIDGDKPSDVPDPNSYLR